LRPAVLPACAGAAARVRACPRARRGRHPVPRRPARRDRPVGGAREGVDNGTVFSVWREGTNTIDRVEKGPDRDADTVFHENKVRLPDEFAGHAMVFRTYDKVSYALVMDGIKPTRIGYHPKHPDAPY